LRNKVLRMMFFVGFVPMIILGLLSFYSIKAFHDADLASIERNLVDQKIEEIKGLMQSITNSFQLRVTINEVDEIQIGGQYFILQQLLDGYPDLEEASFISLTGQETSKVSRLYPDGVSANELLDQSASEKFKTAGNKKDYISPVYFKAEGPAIMVASPVFNRDGVLISVLAGEVTLKSLQAIIERSPLGTTGYLYVVAKDGFMIAHSQKEKLAYQSLDEIDFVRKVTAKISDEATSRYASIWGEPVVAHGKYLDDLQMGIIAEWPVREADLVLNTLNYQYLVVSIFVLIGTLFFSYFLANKIVKPIKALETGTDLIARGKFDQPVDIKTGDEIEELGASFNKMIVGLKRLEELKKEFVFIAAHDLRTPVTAIKGYLSLVLDGSYGQIQDSVKEALEKIKHSNQRLIQLVDDLLQIARAEAGRIPIRVASMSVIQPINEVLEELKPLANEKNIQMIYQPSPDLSNVMADPERLKELMVNLIGNAIKYTLGAGTISITHDIKNGGLVTNVKDTGMGISPENQKKLFEKYFRVENDNMRNIQGTGLGLFIVKQLVEKMNGTIWVESEEGRGSTFSILLPLAKQNPA
jgi:signal transduction histidine kinase